MTEQTITPRVEPELKKKQFNPKGVMTKHGKTMLFLGVAALLLIATVFSAKGKPAAARGTESSNGVLVQDNTENNVADLKSHVADQQHTLDQAVGNDPSLANVTPAQRAAAQAYSANGQTTLCIPGQPCVQAASYGYPQNGSTANLTPAEQASQQLAAKERERADQARFASNLAYSRPPDVPQSSQVQAAVPTGGSDAANSYALAAHQNGGSPIAPRGAGQPAAASADTFKRKPEVNIDSATGQPNVLYEGTTIDTVLMNRLDGDAVGPVKVLVSNPV